MAIQTNLRRQARGPLWGELGGFAPRLQVNVVSISRRISLAVAQKLLGGGLRFTLGLRAPRRFHALATKLRRHQILQLKLLLGGQREQLIGRLMM